jgi:uncharacterized protein YxjI
MKLYIKQKVFSWRDRFSIKDESGNNCFYAQGEILSWRRKLHLYNTSGHKVAYIYQKLFTFLPRYYIEINGQTYVIVKEFTFFKQKYRIEGLPWTMQGNFIAHEYALYNNNTIHNDNTKIMSLSKHWFTWGDSYELDIPNPQNTLLCLCIALCVDCIQADATAAQSSR